MKKCSLKRLLQIIDRIEHDELCPLLERENFLCRPCQKPRSACPPKKGCCTKEKADTK